MDRYLDQHQRTLTDVLDEVLDTEAGLREVLLQLRHDTAVDNLDTVLDAEAGLKAILPATLRNSPSGRPDAQEAPLENTGARRDAFHAVSPVDRMALRSNPEVTAACLDLDRALDLIRHLDPDLVLDRALNLAHDLALDLARARDLNFDGDFNIDDDLDRELTRACVLADDLAGALNNARARGLVRDLNVARDLNIARNRDLSVARNRARDLNIVLDRARDLAHDMDRDLDRARALALVLVDVRANQVGRAIGLVLRWELPALDKDSLHAFLNDFTTADLSSAELGGVDLDGVRWSERGTKWPPVVDVEALKILSAETPPGSKTWIVRSGTATIRDFVELV
ncbi:hypothetical protein [Streptomyces yunnanensis]|uniref:hypothetical protein n=1 Tax=Streptomyces yunnanensis TaxID=156453 RepID=UPI00116102B9|nr:hypothetical protein [Streptomyces yunnanensis]